MHKIGKLTVIFAPSCRLSHDLYELASSRLRTMDSVFPPFPVKYLFNLVPNAHRAYHRAYRYVVYHVSRIRGGNFKMAFDSYGAANSVKKQGMCSFILQKCC